MPPIRAVCFDLDATLVYYNTPAVERPGVTPCNALGETRPRTSLLENFRAAALSVWYRSEAQAFRVDGRLITGMNLIRDVWRETARLCGSDDESIAAGPTNLYWTHRDGTVPALRRRR